jgi:hypothetical protein
MRVEPELLDHPKFLKLEKRVGEGALKALHRLWGHCQGSQRGGRWMNADCEYVEIVCRWQGEPGKLFEAMVEVGFIEKLAKTLVIHDWDAMNSKAKANWTNGRLGGRPRVHPPETQPKPNNNPNYTTPLLRMPLANLRVSESVSESVSIGEREKGAAPGEIEASKLRWGTLNKRITELKAKLRSDRTQEEQTELRDCEKKRAAIEKGQREGKFA